jgi:hypothetical protein
MELTDMDVHNIELISLDPALQVAFTGYDSTGQYSKRIEWFSHNGRCYYNINDNVEVPHDNRLRELLDFLIVEYKMKEKR